MNSKLLYWDLPLLFTWTKVEKSPQLLGKNFVFFSKETFWQTRQDPGESPGERGKQKLTVGRLQRYFPKVSSQSGTNHLFRTEKKTLGKFSQSLQSGTNYLFLDEQRFRQKR